MNADQLKSLIRAVLLAAGTLAVTLGYLTQEQLGPLVGALADAGGAIGIAVSLVWSYKHHA